MTAFNTTLYVSGFEYGTLIAKANPNGIFLTSAGTITIQGTTKRSGSYALKLAPANGAVTNGYDRWHGPSASAAVGRFYIRFATFPDANTAIFTLREGAGGRCPTGFEFNSATNKLRAYVRDESGNVDYTGTDGPTLSTGIWYRVDFLITRPTTTQRRIRWYMNEEGLATASEVDDTLTGVITTSFSYTVYGETTDRGGTTIDGEYYIDDVVITADQAANLPYYPIGEGRVCLLRPSSNGTHVNAGSFTDSGAASPPTSFYTNIDEIPVADSAGDYVYQSTVGAGDYLEATFSDTPADWVSGYANGGVVVWCYDWPVSGTANVYIRVRDTVNSVDLSAVQETGTIYTGTEWSKDKLSPYLNYEGGTKTVYDATSLRWGESTDNSPQINFTMVFVEVDYPSVVGTAAKYGWGLLL